MRFVKDHPLKVYLDETGEPPYLFADRVGLSRMLVYGICNGKFRDIGIVQAARIEIGTKGKVKAQTIFNYLLDNKLLKPEKSK